MSKENKKLLTFEEWLKHAQTHTRDNMARAKAYKDEYATNPSATTSSHDLFSWMEGICFELNAIYEALEHMNENSKSTLALVLGTKPKWKEMKTKAKEFGEFSKVLLNKAREEKAKEKYR